MKPRYSFDPHKAARNIAKHGVDFAAVERFEWGTAKVALDDRYNYGEDRYAAVGFIGSRLHVMIFTPRGGTCRIISLRPATQKEVERYGKA